MLNLFINALIMSDKALEKEFKVQIQKDLIATLLLVIRYLYRKLLT